MVKRLATLVGCNYTGTEHKLHGCINDVLTMRAVLIGRFGFQQEDINILTDAPDSPIQPIGANIKRVLDQMIDRAKSGDILFFYYSGYGTLIPLAEDGPRKYAAAIVPFDFDLITDLYFDNLVNRLPEGATFTILFDSSNGGDLIDKDKEQIGHQPLRRSKTLSIDKIIANLKISVDMIIWGYKVHLELVIGTGTEAKFQRRSFGVEPNKGILLIGSQPDEASVDVNPNSDGSEAYGAFTDAVKTVLNAHTGVISNKELITRAQNVLRKKGFNQLPCLYCSGRNENAPFLRE